MPTPLDHLKRFWQQNRFMRWLQNWRENYHGSLKLTAVAAAEFYIKEEIRAHVVTVPICILGILAFIGYGFIDPFLAPQVFKALLVTRFLIIVCLALVAFLAHRSSISKIFLAHASMCIVSFGVIVVSCLVGGVETHYHEALIAAFFTHAMLVPARLATLMVIFSVVICLYNLAIIMLSSYYNGVLLAVNNAGLVTAACISIVQHLIADRLRKREFLQNQTLNEQHTRLSGLYSDLDTQNKNMETANAKLRTLDDAKNRFFANISHEFRTPLTVMHVALDNLELQLQQYTGQEEQHQVIICRNSAKRLLALINDLLELSRMEDSNFKLSLQAVDVVKIIENAVSDTQVLAKRNQVDVQLSVQREAQVPLQQLADPVQMDRVVLNILANALKYTPRQGFVRVRVQHNAQRLEVAFEDSGQGIPVASLPYVFDRFFQSPDKDGIYLSGSGVGLSLCKKVVEMHGGGIEAANARGGGALVSFWIPTLSAVTADSLLPAVAEPLSPAEGTSEWHQLYRNRYRLTKIEELTERRIVPRTTSLQSGPSILLVEDNRDLVLILSAILGADYQLYIASGGEEGLLLARKYLPDLIISDNNMAQGSGLALLSAIKQDATLQDTPFILITASVDLADRLVATENNVDYYLAKPFEQKEVRSVIARLLRRQDHQKALLLDKTVSSLQVMAEGIAHDIKNPLGFVAGSLALLARTAKQCVQDVNAPREKYVQDIDRHLNAGKEAIMRVTAAIDVLRQFGKPLETAAFELRDINEAVQKVKVVAEANGPIHVDLQATVRVPLRPGHLEQVLLNLVINAQQAAGSQSKVEIGTRNDGKGEGVVIWVKDNGPGMTPQTLKKIFTPYFTTKPTGTGMGLAMAQNMIRGHGGSIRAESTLGAGATFLIRLPGKVADFNTAETTTT